MVMIIILLLCCIARSQVIAITPRVLQGCITLDTRAYCYGGYLSALGGEFVNATSEIYTTDLSELYLHTSYPTLSPNWVRVNTTANTNTSMLEPRAAMSITALNKTHCIISGGESDNNSTLKNSTIIFDTTRNTTSALSPPPFTTYAGSLVATDSNTLWAYGGQLINSTNPAPNTTLKLNISTLPGTWSVMASSSFSPTSNRYGHSVVLINTLIYYFGGFRAIDSNNGTQSLAVPFKTVDFYNTSSDQWGSIMASGITPDTRKYHTSTLIDNSSVLIYGGAKIDRPQSLPVLDYCYIFSITKHAYRRIYLNGNNNPGAGPRSGHSAVLYDKTVFILFGYDSSGNIKNDAHYLDVSEPAHPSWVGLESFGDGDYSWDYDQYNNTRTIVGGVVGGIAFLLMMLGGIIYYHRRKKNRHAANRLPSLRQNRSAEHVPFTPPPIVDVVTNNNNPPEYPTEPAPRYSLHAPSGTKTVMANLHKSH